MQKVTFIFFFYI